MYTALYYIVVVYIIWKSGVVLVPAPSALCEFLEALDSRGLRCACLPRPWT